MKRFCYLLSIIIIASCSGQPKKGNLDVSLKLRVESKEFNKDLLETCLLSRLKEYGIPNNDVEVSIQDRSVHLKIRNADNQKRITTLLTSNGKLELARTYQLAELTSFLEIVNKKSINKDSTASFTNNLDNHDLEEESFTQKKSKGLFELLDFAASQLEPAAIASVSVWDTSGVNKILSDHNAIFPQDIRFLWKHGKDQNQKIILYATRIEKGDEPAITNEMIQSARSDIDQFGHSCVYFTMNAIGTKKWSRLTRECIGKSIAIIFDNRVYTAPLVNRQIDNGNAMITGQFTSEQAQDLATILTAPIPYKLSITEVNSKAHH